MKGLGRWWQMPCRLLALVGTDITATLLKQLASFLLVCRHAQLVNMEHCEGKHMHRHTRTARQVQMAMHGMHDDHAHASPACPSQVDSIQDKTQELLAAVAAGKEISKADAEAAKKRKLIKPEWVGWSHGERVMRGGWSSRQMGGGGHIWFSPCHAVPRRCMGCFRGGVHSGHGHSVWVQCGVGFMRAS